MSSANILSEKFQELLGDKYKIMPLTQLQIDYTTATMSLEGENVAFYQQWTEDYTKLKQNYIVGILSLTSPSRANADFYYVSSSYSLEFSVPMNNQVRNIEGGLLKEPKFTFFYDIDKLIDNVLNKKLQINNKFCKMTINEPVYKGKETDGENQYAIFVVSGNVIISDKANFGSDYKVEINVDGEFVELDGVNTFSEIYNTDANAIVKQGKAKLEQNTAQISWACTLSLDDVETENKARQRLYEIVHENIELINPNGEDEALKRKLPVRITTKSGNVHSFNALVSITFGTTRNGVGSLDISFTDDNKG